MAPSHFVPKAHGEDLELQNTLARFGAHHLKESESVVPSDRFKTVDDLVCRVLVEPGSPRLVTSLAPVLVLHVNGVHPRKLQLRLAEIGADRRFAWLVDNTLDAVRRELLESPPRALARVYRRAEVVLGAFLETTPRADNAVSAPDVFDTDIRSKQTLKEVLASSSPISRRWGIATSLQPEDFRVALRAAHAAG